MKTSRYAYPLDRTRSELMRRVRQRGTKPEDEVAAVLRDLGICFRRNVSTLPGSPDFANKTRKWAIFVNGCFWHRHKGCVRATTPKHNRAFWLAKFAANVVRDKAKTRLLRGMKFKVIVIWECEAANDTRVRRQLLTLRRG
jgi:DNA mismatch endonuclease (patch repair protein)